MKKLFTNALLALGLFAVMIPSMASAVTCTAVNTPVGCEPATCTGINVPYSGCLTPAAGSGLITTKDLGISYATQTGLGTADVRDTVAKIIRVAMGLLGIVAVVIILIGGFTWMTAGGNEEKVGEAKKWIFAGVIGLAIILSAYALANFVITNLVNATTGVV
ncbi:MAG: hypothetical protein US58_C0021G0004 [Candidatus Magasanikbacteria bacterium GW2011_GWA2_37_8]|uniref:Uncharacterized protein n=1 Tax=Candidatus Magasanikbacteria bacterium GW2011_GWA2_37_8 TaxID=1619036 RepID=A0A0G0HDU3_9BACT|nr:MAG: hypothetical protein US58_C0021G0004 [Candidatus Magasanikbacteria bacterium GW2011_GWA2_37_8]